MSEKDLDLSQANECDRKEESEAVWLGVDVQRKQCEKKITS